VIWGTQKLKQVRPSGQTVHKDAKTPIVLHEDLIGESFWKSHPEILRVE